MPDPKPAADDPGAPPLLAAMDALTSLTAEQILQRLDNLRGEEAQLRILLKSVKARERIARKRLEENPDHG